MCSIISLLFLTCAISLIQAQELAFFDKDSTVDFEKDDMLAEMEPAAGEGTTAAYHATTKTVNILAANTSDFMNHASDSDIKTSKLRNAIMRGQTTSVPKGEDNEIEDIARVAPVLAVDDSMVKELLSTTADNEDIATTEETMIGVETGLSGLQDLFDVSVGMPPYIRHPLSQEIIIVLQQHRKGFSITCRADGHPHPYFKWHKDDQLLDNTPSILSVFDNGTIFFNEFSNREDGLYQCFATNKFGTSVSPKVPIVYERPPGALTSDANLTQAKTATEGDSISFDCAKTPQTVPEYTKRWYLKLSTETPQLQITDRIGTDSNGVLRFAYVEPDDAKQYICALAPQVAAPGDAIRFYNTAILQVQNVNTKTKSSPSLAYASKIVKATLGRNVTLECFFSGYPIPKLTWQNNSNHVIQEGDKKFAITDFGRKLIIIGVQEVNDGVFTCTADNNFGKMSTTIILNVTAPPQKSEKEGLSTIIHPDGKNIVLMCKAKRVGRQLLDIPVWYRNGKPFDESSLPFPLRYNFRSNRTELHINNLNKELDTACFQCNISNSEGYIFYDGYLRVINSIKIEKEPKEYYFITRNSNIDISVQATGDECCEIDYRWHLNGFPLTNELKERPFVWDEYNDILLFDASNVDNDTLNSKMGNYTCRVSNNYETRNVHFIISMNNSVSVAESLRVNEGGIELWWIGLVCGILLIVIAVAVIIVIIKSNYPRDTYPLEKEEIMHHLNPEKDLLDQSFQEI